MRRHGARRHDHVEAGDQPRIEPIILGPHAAGFGELMQLEGIDAARRQAGRQQGAQDPALVAAAGLEAEGGDVERTQSCNQLGPAGRVVGEGETLLLGQDHDIHAVLGDVDAGIGQFCPLRIPYLLMRARALATVRAWKRRPEHQAHSRSDIRGGSGLAAETGSGS